jgi:23S rRNA (adenine2503-C2)-methyltransferase
LAEIFIDSLSRSELVEFVTSCGMQKFRGNQIYKWVYHKGAESVAEMTDLSVKDRESLAGMVSFTQMSVAAVRESAVDGSVKFLFTLGDGEQVEAVILNDGRRYTACISSQVGCRMGCAFCSTAKMGLVRNLTMGEIIKQVKRLNEYLAEKGTKLNNLVFMGMGEPLDNLDNVKKSLGVLLDDDGYGFSHRKITLSTCGLTDKIQDLFSMETPVNLAVSVNAADNDTRKGIMPVSNKYPLSDLIKQLKGISLQKRKYITIEHVLLFQYLSTVILYIINLFLKCVVSLICSCVLLFERWLHQ